LVVIVQRLINGCWFAFKWITLLGIVAAVTAGFYVYHRIDETIRQHVQARFAEHYAGLKVTIRSAQLVKGVGIEIRGLSVVEPGAEGPRPELLYVEEIRIACETDLQELLVHDPEAREVLIRRPTLAITRRPSGVWSASKLLPWPKLGEHHPPVKIENGTVEIFDPLKTPSSTLTLRDVNLVLAAPTLADPSGIDSSLRRLQGTLTGDHFRQMDIEGLVNPHLPQWNISGSVEGLEISPTLVAALPGPLSNQLSVVESLRGEGEVGFRVAFDPAAEQPYRFDVYGQLSRGRIDDARLPHPLTDVRARLRCDNQGYFLEELAGRSGQSLVRLSGRQSGYAPGSPMQLTAEIRQLELDRQLLGVLPNAWKDLWYKYLPAGPVNIDARLNYDGLSWHPELHVNCLNVAFTYHKFPYRMECGRGSIDLRDDVLELKLTAQTGQQPVKLEGRIERPLAGPSGWIVIAGDDIPIDDKLIEALPERSRAVVRSLDPRGSCNVWARIGRDQPTDPLRQNVVIGLNRCMARYDRFPYSLANVRGTLEMVDGQWAFNNLEATNSTGRIRCSGALTCGTAGAELYLKIIGNDVPLEEELRDALKPQMRQLWNDLRPHGCIDVLAEVRYHPLTNAVDVSVVAEPQARNCWIEPVPIPYRLEKLEGVITYREGKVRLDRMRSQHGAVTLACTGGCEFLADGGWQFRLDDLNVDRLGLDRELIPALPGKLRRALTDLNPSGPVNVRGTLVCSRGGKPSDPMLSQWDVRVGFQRGSIDCGLRLDNLHGEIGLAGDFDGQNFRCRGELAVDSVNVRDIQFTQVQGPFWIDDAQVLLGTWVDRPKPGQSSAAEHQPRAVTANLYGGTVYGDGRVVLGAVPRYQFDATLSQADLAACAREMGAGKQNLSGKILAKVDLRGAGRTINSLEGGGRVSLRDANIYQLPLMISLLKILSIRQPDTTAFSQSDIEYRIQGNHIYLDRIDFNGDAISLLGRGEMNFESQILLTFHAVVGRAQLNLPVLRDVVGGASEQIMSIHVGGTLQDPQVRREAFPAVNKALQFLKAGS